MSDGGKSHNLGIVLKDLLSQRALSLREFSRLTGIDTATISRIINGKRKATPEHLQRFADYLGVPSSMLFEAAGYPIDQKQSDIHTSIDHIQSLLESTNLLDKEFRIEDVKQELAKYEHYSQTDEGKETILTKFDEKLQKVGSIGPFISQLKEMHERFSLKKGTKVELALIGSALIYFILTVDCIPDYLFPIGYIDDAIAIKLVLNHLSPKK